MGICLLLAWLFIQTALPASADIKLPFTDFRAKITPVKPNSLDRTVLDTNDANLIPKLISITPKIDFSQSYLYSEDNALKSFCNEYSSPLFLKSTSSGLSVPKIDQPILDSIKPLPLPSLYTSPPVPKLIEKYFKGNTFQTPQFVPKNDEILSLPSITNSPAISDMVSRNRLALERLSLQNSYPVPSVTSLPTVPLEQLKFNNFDFPKPNFYPQVPPPKLFPYWDVPKVYPPNIYLNPFSPEYSMPPLYYNSRTLPTVTKPECWYPLKPFGNLETAPYFVEPIMNENEYNIPPSFIKEPSDQISDFNNAFSQLGNLVNNLKSIPTGNPFKPEKEFNLSPTSQISTLATILKALGDFKAKPSQKTDFKKPANDPLDFIAPNFDFRTPSCMNNFEKNINIPENYGVPDLGPTMSSFIDRLNFKTNVPNFDTNMKTPEFSIEHTNFDPIKFPVSFPSSCAQNFEKSMKSHDFSTDYTNFEPVKFTSSFPSPCIFENKLKIPEYTYFEPVTFQTTSFPSLPDFSLQTPCLLEDQFAIPSHINSVKIEPLIKTALPTNTIKILPPLAKSLPEPVPLPIQTPVFIKLPELPPFDFPPPPCPSFLPPPCLPQLVIEPPKKRSKTKKNMEKLLDLFVLSELLGGDDKDVDGLDALLALLSLT